MPVSADALYPQLFGPDSPLGGGAVAVVPVSLGGVDFDSGGDAGTRNSPVDLPGSAVWCAKTNLRSREW